MTEKESPEFWEAKKISALTSERRGAPVLHPEQNVPGHNLMFVLVIVGFNSAHAAHELAPHRDGGVRAAR